MQDSLWNRVVIIENHGTITHHIRTTREAAWYLLDDWSGDKGASYGSALVACTNALSGKVPDAIARFLFVAAAQEAKLGVKTLGDIHESDPVLSELTEAAFRELFGLEDIVSFGCSADGE